MLNRKKNRPERLNFFIDFLKFFGEKEAKIKIVERGNESKKKIWKDSVRILKWKFMQICSSY